MDETTAESRLAWQQRRRRPGTGGTPVGGFGADGSYTLWLPRPAASVRYEFRGGRSVRVAEAGQLTPAIVALRDDVLRSLRSEGASRPGIVSVDLRFLDYAAAVVLANYDLPDADLTFILSGSRWMQPMIHHLMGGEDVARVLAEHGPELSRRLTPPPPAPPDPAPAFDAPPAKPRRRWFGLIRSLVPTAG